jgi:hypothetical protein
MPDVPDCTQNRLKTYPIAISAGSGMEMNCPMARNFW